MRDNKKLEKTWRAIAAKVSKEPDSDKVAKLSEELIQALDKDTRERFQHLSKPGQKARRKSA